MKTIVWAVIAFCAAGSACQNTGQFDAQAAQRFAGLALACAHKEYPNHMSHTLNSDADVAPPRELTADTTGILPCTGTGCSSGWRGRFRMRRLCSLLARR